MKQGSFEQIAEMLHQHGVRYLVAGGLAVVAHGYLRYTKDADLVVQLTAENIRRAFAALGRLGYRPLAPLQVDQFADPHIREQLLREKGMQVLQFWSDQHPETPIDLFVHEPFGFDQEYANAWSSLCAAKFPCDSSRSRP